MKAYIKSNPKKRPNIYITASDALNSHINSADIKCDGTADEQQILSAYEEISDIGGVIQLSEGNFNFEDVVDINDQFITIRGSGDGATKITQTTSNIPAFDLYNQDGCELSDLRVIMPSTDNGDGIKTGTGITMRNVGIQGGSESNYLIRLTDSFNFNLQNIKGHGRIGNGIMFDYTGELYYGNGSLRNVQFSMKANTIGVYLDARYNLSHFDTINIVTGQGTGNNIYGFYINGAFNNSYDMLDLEGLDYSVKLTNSAKGNHFTRLYSTARYTDIYCDTATKNNLFISHQNGSTIWKIINNGSNNLSERNRFINLAMNAFSYESEPPRFYDDFNGANISNVWDKTGTVILANGLATITTQATAYDIARIDFGGNGGYKDVYESYMEFKAKRISSGDYDVYMGLCNGDFSEANHGAYLRALNTDTNWMLVNVKGDTLTEVDSGVAIDTTAHTFKIHKTNTSIGVNYFIDNVWVGRVSNVPTTTISREPIFQITTQEDAAKSLAIDYVILQQGRALTP